MLSPAPHTVKCRERGRGHARGAADGGDAAFQSRHFSLERRHGGIGKAGIKIAVALQIEQIRHILRLFVNVGRALYDGGMRDSPVFGL